MLRLLANPRMAKRILISAWYILCAAARLGFRLSWNCITRTRTTRGRIIGRALAQVLQSLGPTYIKLSQRFSTRRDLFSAEVIDELSRLQDRLPPPPFGFVLTTLRQELGVKFQEAFCEFDTKPVSSASIASVYRGRLRDGRPVAVKVLRPNIARLIREDRRLLLWTALCLEHFPPLRRIPISSAIAEFCECLERQIDLRLEAAANRRLRSALVPEPRIIIPALVDELCSASIITMEFIEGFHCPMPEESDELREATCAVLRALYRMIFVEGFVHCDLHWGNLHFLNDGRAAMVDFGFMAELSAAERFKFAEFFYGLATKDGKRCAKITLETAFFIPSNLNRTLFEMAVTLLVDRFSSTEVRDFQVSDFVIQLFNIQRDYGIVGTSAFTMAIVSLLVFEGIAKVVYPDLDFQREAIPFIFHMTTHGTRAMGSSTFPLSGRSEAARETRREKSTPVILRKLK